MTNSKSKTLHYKIAELMGHQAGELQSLLKTAYSKFKLATSRMQMVNEEDRSYRLINSLLPSNGILCGVLIEYSEEQFQAYAKANPEAEEFNLDAMKAPKNSHFIQSILYFGVLSNHVVLLQAGTLKATQLESHLTWLLQRAKLISDEQFFALCDQPPPKFAKDMKDTTAIGFSAPIEFKTVDSDSNVTERIETRITIPDESKEENKTQVKSIKYRPTGMTWDALRKIFPPDIQWPETMDVQSIVENRELVVDLKLSWKGARKQSPTTLLDGIARQFRHLDDEADWKIETRNGPITKEAIKCRQVVSLGVSEKGFIKRDELWKKMADWLQELTTTNRILAGNSKK